ncbi:MAG: LPS export ABC transporter periplasmic protein LptC [Fimbriimonadales bacterium]
MLALAALAGCVAKKPVANQPKEKEKPVLEQQMIVNTPEGEATQRNPKTRQVTYHVRWKKAQINVEDKGPFAGNMESVSGEIYDKKGIASTFSGDLAKASKETQFLTLTGHVVVISNREKATITCDRVEYHGDEKIVKAFGNVQVQGTYGMLSGLNEIWATPDLNYKATPGMFKKPSTPGKFKKP